MKNFPVILSFYVCVLKSCFATGIYKAAISFPFHVDISCVQEFLAITNFSDSVEIGASVTLNDVAKHLSQNADQSVTFEPIASHIMQIAGNPVRNVSFAPN